MKIIKQCLDIICIFHTSKFEIWKFSVCDGCLCDTIDFFLNSMCVT